MKIVINTCYGGFGFSKDFVKYWESRYHDLYPDYDLDDYQHDDVARTYEPLISALEEFGVDEASTSYSSLEIVSIPDEATDYMIDEYDGMESIIYVLDGRLRMI